MWICQKSKKSGGDYNREQLADAMGKAAIVGDAVEHYREAGNGALPSVSMPTLHIPKQTAAAFTSAGIPAVHVDADTTEAELKDACMGLDDGSIIWC